MTEKWFDVRAWLCRAACQIALPLIRVSPAGRVRLLGWLGGGQGSRAWDSDLRPIRIFWDSDLQSWIQVDLRDWGGRWHYFPGRYYDQLLPWVMYHYLRPGDLFVDVGANFGIHSIRGSRLVGVTGRVVAIEPSPGARERLALHMAMNSICNVTVVPVATGAKLGHGTLHIDANHLGTASLRENCSLGDGAVTVSVQTLDSIIEPPTSSIRALVKIDVEGFELETIRGAGRWLQRSNTCFVIEITPDWIASMGGDPQELFDSFREQGYSAYAIGREPHWYRAAPRFLPVERPGPDQCDYLFLRSGDPARDAVFPGPFSTGRLS